MKPNILYLYIYIDFIDSRSFSIKFSLLHSLAMVKLFAEYKSILLMTLRQLRNPFMTTAV